MGVLVQGTCDRRFRLVQEQFEENFASRGEVGASLAVMVDGRIVADLWGGHMDEARTRPWERDTIVCVYSATKGMTATCAHHLVEQGLLDLDAPVTRYWPEFGQAGKGRIPVRWLLSHRAGLPAVREPLPLGSHYRWEVMTEALARTEPWWEPGTKHGYHSLAFGWLVGEVIRRVSSRSVGVYCREHVAGPLGLDFHIGMGPEHDHRTATILYAPPLRPGEDPGPQAERMKDRQSMAYKSLMNPKDMMAMGTVNTRAWRAAEIPAANGHSNARALARAYGALALGGTLDGVHVLNRETIESAIVEQSAGMDENLGRVTRVGLGFRLAAADDYYGPNLRTFGHPGAGGALGFGDLDARLGFGYAMNQMSSRVSRGGDPRWRPMIDAVYTSLGYKTLRQ